MSVSAAVFNVPLQFKQCRLMPFTISFTKVDCLRFYVLCHLHLRALFCVNFFLSAAPTTTWMKIGERVSSKLWICMSMPPNARSTNRCHRFNHWACSLTERMFAVSLTFCRIGKRLFSVFSSIATGKLLQKSEKFWFIFFSVHFFPTQNVRNMQKSPNDLFVIHGRGAIG